MAGKKGRGKKGEPVTVEAADSTSLEDQSHQNEENDAVELKKAAISKKGGKGKKENVEKIVDVKINKPAAVTKRGKGKKQESNGDSEELNGDTEIKKDLEIANKKGKSKKEQNNEPPVKVSEAKKGRPKKAEIANVQAPELKEEKNIKESEDKKKKDNISPKKAGRKRAAEIPLVENGNLEETEIIDSKKQKKEKDTKSKESEEESTSAPAKSGRGRKKKEEVATEKSSPVITPKLAKGGKGKKRGKEDDNVNEGIEDINLEEKIEHTVAKKEKKTKATAKASPKNKDVAEKKAKVNETETQYDSKDFEFNKEYTLKISSWNVAGLRSWINKGGLKYFEYEKSDIFCLQEIKCSTDMMPAEAKIEGYHLYWHCMTGGYAGVAIYSKIMPINMEYGIGDDEQDANARIMTAEYEKFYLINTYVPNAGKKLINLSKRMRWDNLFHEYIVNLNKKKPVIICGDMNVSHQEIDLANPKTNKKNAGFSQEERDGMTKLLSLGFIDTFRYLYPDKEKAYTFWTYMMKARSKNVGWRLDYFLTSEKLAKKIVENVMRSQVMGSDHCPITLYLNI